ncbi:siderophore-interacting protein [Actinokineospora auranticolor]|uniref:NADPH-dependent ferric siderophore reductase n=1 Tax=Actinokineospora auranticolor TaxID=155976 RepID=A0A2S6GEJ3_9PSEU|nr:siderophore-interacting protein [Actinokineospora auranticolor]PPK63649.1 NADPH-dependent ferric siderophore reductase [Actinokineospora auranticolor]
MSVTQSPRPTPAGRDSLRPYRLTVAAKALVTPHLARITLTGPDLAHFTEVGPEPRCKVLLPPRPGAEVVVPDAVPFWDEVRALPESLRPIVRTYTVRAARPADLELDIDFVLHGDTGPASAWAGAAAVGDPVGLYGCLSSFAPPADTSAYLVVGDETALPAISGIVGSLSVGARARVLLEVDGAADEQPLASAADLDVTWLHRDGAEPGTTTLLHDAVTAVGAVDPRTYAWVAGESAMAQAVRATLVLDHDLTRQRVYFSGYWRRGHAEDD